MHICVLYIFTIYHLLFLIFFCIFAFWHLNTLVETLVHVLVVQVFQLLQFVDCRTFVIGFKASCPQWNIYNLDICIYVVVYMYMDCAAFVLRLYGEVWCFSYCCGKINMASFKNFLFSQISLWTSMQKPLPNIHTYRLYMYVCIYAVGIMDNRVFQALQKRRFCLIVRRFLVDNYTDGWKYVNSFSEFKIPLSFQWNVRKNTIQWIYSRPYATKLAVYTNHIPTILCECMC